MNISDTTILARANELFPPDDPGNQTIDWDVQLQPSTVDLRLDNIFYVQKMAVHTEQRRIDPRTADGSEYFVRKTLPTGEPFVMQPGPHNFILGSTMEFVQVPTDMVAFVDGRSSYGRWGLRIHSTAGLIDAGFRGKITLEISLDSRYELVLHPGDRICQIRFETLDYAATRPYGHASRKSKYQNQAGAVPSLSKKDGEAR
jgi:dCTP deaminase